MHRKIIFMLAKGVKYLMWAVVANFCYHMYVIKKYEKPEQAFLVSQPFLEAAKFADWSIYDFHLLMTRPGMTKMLPDRMEFPG